MFDRFIIVLSHSWRTQAAIAFGIIVSLAILLAGKLFVPDPIITGPLAPMNEALAELVAKRYAFAALVNFVSSMLYAIKCYRRDSRRLFGH